MEGTVCATVKVSDGLDILVGATPSIMSGNFTIGWSRWKFTYEHVILLSIDSIVSA